VELCGLFSASPQPPPKEGEKYNLLTVSAFGGYSIDYRKILRGNNLTKFLTGLTAWGDFGFSF
jgi:hypothetical protein